MNSIRIAVLSACLLGLVFGRISDEECTKRCEQNMPGGFSLEEAVKWVYDFQEHYLTLRYPDFEHLSKEELREIIAQLKPEMQSGGKITCEDVVPIAHKMPPNGLGLCIDDTM